MRPPTCLRLLRPRAWKPLDARNAAYLRFYHAARHAELVKAGALKYPRIRHDGTPMSFPVFRERFGQVEEGHVVDEEVVVRGRVRFVRNASSKLMFVALSSDFTKLQAMFDFSKLDQTKDVSLDSFKQISKLLNRGDIVCMLLCLLLRHPASPDPHPQPRPPARPPPGRRHAHPQPPP
jgi:lysyl-tRNA synthetase class 2